MKKGGELVEASSEIAVVRSRLRAADVWREAYISTSRRPLRTILTALGTILGVAVIVAISGIASTANQQVSSSFNAVLATQVEVSANGIGDIPLNSENAVLRLNGVRAAGISWQVSDSVSVASNPEPQGASSYSHLMPLFAATANGLNVMGPDLMVGRLFDQGNEIRDDRVAILGSDAAQSLGIRSVLNQPAIFIQGVAFTVIGIADGLARQAGALTGVTIPASSALNLLDISQTGSNSNGVVSGLSQVGQAGGSSGEAPTMFVITRPGAANVVGREVRFAINPRRPNTLRVLTPPSPTTLKSEVEGTTQTLILVLGLLCLLIGIVAIANTTLLAVIERVGEIGLRRSLGARAWHITVVTLAEAGMIGTAGGLVGTMVGILVIEGVCIAETWTPILTPGVLLVSPLIGFCAGIVAGLYPALKATRVSPVAALQR